MPTRGCVCNRGRSLMTESRSLTFRAERRSGATQMSVDDELGIVEPHRLRVAPCPAVIQGSRHVVDPACVLADAQTRVDSDAVFASGRSAPRRCTRLRRKAQTRPR